MKKILRELKKDWEKKFSKYKKESFPVPFAGSKFLSKIYYAFFDPSFSREFNAVLQGKVKHIKEAKELKANYFLLVRNTHRIEKGILMRPRRPVFGKDYLEETIDSFQGVWAAGFKDNNNQQLKWFTDVLQEYFALACGKDALVDQQYKRFVDIIDGNKDFSHAALGSKSIPYFRLDENKSNISYDEFFKLCRQRRSVRWFLNKEVPRELIDKAILAANQAPSACNRQPFEFRIFDEAMMVEKGVKLPMGTTGYGHSIPVFVVLVGNLDAYFDERDRHVIYIDASLASMNLMLALETLGLSSCAINWPDLEQREVLMEDFLKLEKYQRPIMCLGLGYADPEGMVAFSEKRSLEQIRRYN